jgi:hypothetical protein
MEIPDKELTRRQQRAEFWAAATDSLHDRDTVAAARHVERQTLELEAIRGGGIPYLRIGRRALYRKADVLDWIAKNSQRVESTAQLAA